VRREFLGGEDTDSDEPLPIPYRLQGQRESTVNTLIELTSDDAQSDKENHNDEHPGEGWITYDPNNQEHYVVAAEDAGGRRTRCTYIKYVMTDDGSFIHGATGRAPRSSKNPYKRVARTRGPISSTTGKFGTTCFTRSPPLPKLRDMVDRHVHDMRDPGLSADIARYRARTATQEELTGTGKKLKERLHSNHDDLIATPSPHLCPGPHSTIPARLRRMKTP